MSVEPKVGDRVRVTRLAGQVGEGHFVGRVAELEFDEGRSFANVALIEPEAPALKTYWGGSLYRLGCAHWDAMLEVLPPLEEPEEPPELTGMQIQQFRVLIRPDRYGAQMSVVSGFWQGRPVAVVAAVEGDGVEASIYPFALLVGEDILDEIRLSKLPVIVSDSPLPGSVESRIWTPRQG